MENTPIYIIIYEDIKSKINSGFYQLNDKLPTGDELAQHYGCSKLTVKKAIDKLVQEGMVIRRRGSGSFVKGKSTSGNKMAFGIALGSLDKVERSFISSQTITFSIEKPSQLVADKLAITADDYIYRIVRLRRVKGVPYSLEHTFMPLAIVTGLEERHLKDSIYTYIRENLKLKMQSAHVWVRGDRPTEEDQTLLGIAGDDFMMEIEKIATLADGRVFEYSLTRQPYEDFVFETVFVQN